MAEFFPKVFDAFCLPFNRKQRRDKISKKEKKTFRSICPKKLIGEAVIPAMYPKQKDH